MPSSFQNFTRSRKSNSALWKINRSSSIKQPLPLYLAGITLPHNPTGTLLMTQLHKYRHHSGKQSLSTGHVKYIFLCQQDELQWDWTAFPPHENLMQTFHKASRPYPLCILPYTYSKINWSRLRIETTCAGSTSHDAVPLGPIYASTQYTIEGFEIRTRNRGNTTKTSTKWQKNKEYFTKSYSNFVTLTTKRSNAHDWAHSSCHCPSQVVHNLYVSNHTHWTSNVSKLTCPITYKISP